MYDNLVKRLRAAATISEALAILLPHSEGNATAKLHNEAADAIEELPKWIPITEQLPPAEKEVYVTDGEYIARANLLDEVFSGDKPCWSYSGLGEITHWCERIPLPKPPKEGEK